MEINDKNQGFPAEKQTNVTENKADTHEINPMKCVSPPVMPTCVHYASRDKADDNSGSTDHSL